MSEEKKDQTPAKSGGGLDRRDFLQGLATAPVLGAFGLALGNQMHFDKKQKEKVQANQMEAADLPKTNVALLGAGSQGQVLMNAMLKLPYVNFVAVCDIWEEFNLIRATRTLKAYKHDVRSYTDYKEMLAKEKDNLDAVVVATPDFWHATHAIACLEAGLDVYCEKEMSNTLEGARSMVEAARRTGKKLQIGHQRRSHPRYRHCYDKIISEAEMLGRIVTVNGQWNRSVTPPLGYPKRAAMPKERLKKYGFESMEQFRNWRWYKGLGGGAIVDLGSHQIDIYSWFLQANPKAVMASGGNDYYPTDVCEWYDTVMVVYEYDTPKGPARAYYQTQTTNGSQGYYEKFMGDEGTLIISESEANNKGAVYRESTAPAWDQWVEKGYISAPKINTPGAEPDVVLDVRETATPDEHKIPVDFNDLYHRPHLDNFFQAVHGQAELNCPPEIGYETAVAVLKVNEAIKAQKRLEFKPEEFHV